MDWLRTSIGDVPAYWALVALLIPQVVALLIMWLSHKHTQAIADRNNKHALTLADQNNKANAQLNAENAKRQATHEHERWLVEQRQVIYSRALTLDMQFIKFLSADMTRDLYNREFQSLSEKHGEITTLIRLHATNRISKAWDSVSMAMDTMRQQREKEPFIGEINPTYLGGIYRDNKPLFDDWSQKRSRFLELCRSDLKLAGTAPDKHTADQSKNQPGTDRRSTLASLSSPKPDEALSAKQRRKHG